MIVLGTLRRVLFARDQDNRKRFGSRYNSVKCPGGAIMTGQGYLAYTDRLSASRAPCGHIERLATGPEPQFAGTKESPKICQSPL